MSRINSLHSQLGSTSGFGGGTGESAGAHTGGPSQWLGAAATSTSIGRENKGKERLGGGKETNAGTDETKIFTSAKQQEALQLLACLPKGSKMYELQLGHLEAMSKLQFEKDRLESERVVESLRERIGQEQGEAARQKEHEDWLAEQKRQVVAARMRKTLARERLQGQPGQAGGGSGVGADAYGGGTGGAASTQAAGAQGMHRDMKVD